MTTDSFITCLAAEIVNKDRKKFCKYLLLQVDDDHTTKVY